MSNLGRWCLGCRRWAVAGWLLNLVVVAGLTYSARSNNHSNLSLSGTVQAEVNLLTKDFHAVSGQFSWPWTHAAAGES